MHEQLMEAVVSAGNLERALRALVRNKGAAGIDKMTTGTLAEHFAGAARRSWRSSQPGAGRRRR
jgi:hypothetical protein